MKTLPAISILNALGGRQFLMLSHAANLLNLNDGIYFEVGSTKNNANKVYIHICDNNKYEMKFYRFSPDILGMQVVGKFDNLALEDIHSKFDEETGYFTSIQSIVTLLKDLGIQCE
jgi:hypothetical protein